MSPIAARALICGPLLDSVRAPASSPSCAATTYALGSHSNVPSAARPLLRLDIPRRDPDRAGRTSDQRACRPHGGDGQTGHDERTSPSRWSDQTRHRLTSRSWRRVDLRRGPNRRDPIPMSPCSSTRTVSFSPGGCPAARPLELMTSLALAESHNPNGFFQTGIRVTAGRLMRRTRAVLSVRRQARRVDPRSFVSRHHPRLHLVAEKRQFDPDPCAPGGVDRCGTQPYIDNR